MNGNQAYFSDDIHFSADKDGVPGRTRTVDSLIKSQLLCLLSYGHIEELLYFRLNILNFIEITTLGCAPSVAVSAYHVTLLYFSC